MQSPHVEDVPQGRTWIKFCGCQTWSDVSTEVETGADAVGFIFASSPRRVRWDDAREIARRIPPDVEPVGVFVDPSPEEINAVRMLFPRMSVQLSGNETAEFVHRYGERAIKAIHIDGHTLPVGATIWAAGVAASPAAGWIGVETDKAGRIRVAPDLSVPGVPDTFAIGGESRSEICCDGFTGAGALHRIARPMLAAMISLPSRELGEAPCPGA